MPGAWSINVDGRIYGPFTSERMKSFAAEGRLATHSLVAHEGAIDWRKASDEPEFSGVFSGNISPKEANEISAAAASAPMSVADSAAEPIKPALSLAPKMDAAEGNFAHFAVVIDQKSHTTGNIEEAIASLGLSYRLMPNIWIVSTNQTVNAVRNRLVQELGKLDSLFVIDASRGKAAWFNFGPDVDVRIRRVWRKAS